MIKLGLVFAGGGGKGAYEIGVWKAMRETGFDRYVSAVAGTSVGGLNAALFVQGDYEKAQQIWEHISPGQILSQKVILKEAVKKGQRYRHSIFTREGMCDIIDNNLNLSIFDDSSQNCYLSCYKVKEETKFMRVLNAFGLDEISGRQHQVFQKFLISEQIIEKKATYLNLRNYSFEERKQILLATSAIPIIFPDEQVRNMHFVDGSVKDNVPIWPLYNQEKCNMIVVVHLKQNSDLIDCGQYPNAAILEIVPDKSLGKIFDGVLDFDPSHAKMRLEAGYRDALPVFGEMRDRLEAEMNQQKKAAGRIIRKKAYQKRRQEQEADYAESGIMEVKVE